MQKQSKLLQYAHQLFQDARESYYQAAQARARAGVELERAEDLRTAFAEAFARPARSASELYAAGRGAKRATPPRSAQPPAIPLSSYSCCELTWMHVVPQPAGRQPSRLTSALDR